MEKNQNIPSKEDILQYYIAENHSQRESAAHFGLSLKKFITLKSELDIKKPREKVGKLAGATRKSKTGFMPTKDELYRLYITELQDTEEIAALYSVSVHKVRSWLQEYNIKKTRDQTQQTIARKTEKLYGKAFYKTPESLEKAKQTYLRKYGVTNPSFSPEIRKKISEAERFPRPPRDEFYDLYITQNLSRKECAAHYGVTVSLVESWVKEFNIKKDRKLVTERTRQTNIERYGAPNPLQNEQIKQKQVERNIAKYGVPNPASKNVAHFDIWSDYDAFVNTLKTWPTGQKPTLYELADYFNVHHSRVAGKIHELHLEHLVDIWPMKSQEEQTVVDFLQNELGIPSSDIVRGDREALSGFEIDIYLPKYNFGIEYNGIYWHSDIQKKYSDHSGRSVVHQRKSLLAESKGIFLFQIFEHEWNERFASKNDRFWIVKENIKNRIRTILGLNQTLISARKCLVKTVPEEKRRRFMDQYHIQGAGLYASETLGLYFEGKLISCMSFRKSKNSSDDWELSRFCSEWGVNIRGGASKLFAHFTREYLLPGETVVSYSDITKTSGKVYAKLGFVQRSIGAPNYWWINLNTCDVRTRYQEQAGGEVERMHNQHYVRVCDSGTKTWVYTKCKKS